MVVRLQKVKYPAGFILWGRGNLGVCGITSSVDTVLTKSARSAFLGGIGSQGTRRKSTQIIQQNRGQGRGNQEGTRLWVRAIKYGSIGSFANDPNVVTYFVSTTFHTSVRGLEASDLVSEIEIEKLAGIYFDVIIGMDWLSNYKAKIVCHQKVVRIPLPDGKVLRVLGERPEEKVGFLRGDKVGDKKQEEIVVVREFLRIFPG
ncbi:putative reverse transcriptase domain-containing protein [Tanacetum coccineum]